LVGHAIGHGLVAHPATILLLLGERRLLEPLWRATDDMQMALSVVEVLRHHGAVDQDALARGSGTRYLPRAPFGGRASSGTGATVCVAHQGAPQR
jgi:hypothetical protein